MQFIFLLFIGIAAGFILPQVMDIKAGLPVTIGLGVAGALVGGFAVKLVTSVVGMVAGLAGAVVGALAVVWIGSRFLG